MINDKILNKLIPFVGDSFIDFPMYEEGYWVPRLHFFQIFDTDNEAKEFFKYLKKICGDSYIFEFEKNNNLFDIYIMPKYSIANFIIKYSYPNWSIDEMIQLAIASLTISKNSK